MSTDERPPPVRTFKEAVKPTGITSEYERMHMAYLARIRAQNHGERNGGSSASPISVMTAGEQQAQMLDNGDLEGFYELDERQFWIFDSLHYSQEREKWIARLRPQLPTALSYNEVTHAQTIDAIERMHSVGIKPSQALRALRAFEAQLDRDAAQLFATATAPDLPEL